MEFGDKREWNETKTILNPANVTFLAKTGGASLWCQEPILTKWASLQTAAQRRNENDLQYKVACIYTLLHCMNEIQFGQKQLHI